ncbi:FIST C-terminal domain-containing protein [bacterium]|nr:FIST C-terminal domain-containing protein [bacterium]
MSKILVCLLTLAVAVAFVGCDKPKDPAGAGEKASVAFGVGSCTDEDPVKAATTAATEALKNLGVPAKGIIFYEYFPVGGDGDDKDLPLAEKEAKVLPAVRTVTKDIPIIGCRARSLVNSGTKLANTVSVLAIGGDGVACAVAKAKLETDRLAVGKSIAEQVKGVKDIKMVFALSEMNLSFDTSEGVSVEDFIRGIVGTAGKDVALFGGNCFPNKYPDDKGGVQFINDEKVEGCVVAMGIGGPIAIHANHTNEFDQSEETCEVTKIDDKWILELNGKPAAAEYRRIHGMKAEDPFTSDSEHPIGVIVAPGKVYLRMVLEENKENGALRFVAAVPAGTKIKILIGGKSAEKILSSATEGITESVKKAGDAKPLIALLSDCCARGGRLRGTRKADECEITQAILPALKGKGEFPIFGFYAWGELGPIAGTFNGLDCMYQQHTFVSAVITEAK